MRPLRKLLNIENVNVWVPVLGLKRFEMESYKKESSILNNFGGVELPIYAFYQAASELVAFSGILYGLKELC